MFYLRTSKCEVLIDGLKRFADKRDLFLVHDDTGRMEIFACALGEGFKCWIPEESFSITI